jgi:predicted XRE-type DNA-binding protein
MSYRPRMTQREYKRVFDMAENGEVQRTIAIALDRTQPQISSILLGKIQAANRAKESRAARRPVRP